MRVISAKIRTVRDFKRRHGLLATLGMLVLQPLWSLGIFRAGYILALRMDSLGDPDESTATEVEHRFLTAEEIELLASTGESDFPRYVCDLGVARGDSCWGSFVEGRLASIAWLAETPFVQWGSLLAFPEGFVFTHDRFTLSPFRGRRLQGAATQALLRRLGDRGVQGLLCTVDVTNKASLKAVRRTGYVSVGLLAQFAFRGKGRTFLSRRAREAGFSVIHG